MKKIWIPTLIIILMISSCTGGDNPIQDQLEIHDIQGCSHTSPYVGKRVSDIVGVVTHKVSNGFTMQAVTPDDQFCSSEAIFVFTKNYPLVMVADLVRVNGIVEEFADGAPEHHNLSQTEIGDSKYKILQSDYMLPAPIVIEDLIMEMPTLIIENDEMRHFDPHEDGLDFFESLESMLVQIRSGQVIEPRNAYNEISVLSDVLINENLVSSHGALLNTQFDANPEKLMIKLPTIFDGIINVGDRFDSPITGVMDYSYGNFKLLALSPVEIKHQQPIIEPFIPVSDGLSLATYNVENLSPMDEDKKFSEIARQIVKYLQSPDVLVLNEILDNSGSIDDGNIKADTTIQKLIASIQKAGGPEYAFSDTPPINNQDGGLEGGNIRTVLLFRQDKGITLDKEFSQSQKMVYKNGNLSFNQNPLIIGESASVFNGTRKPRVWLLTQNDQQFVVVGVHLTSQGANSPYWGNLQPPQKPEEHKRVDQAQLIFEQVSKIYAFNSDIPIFIVGDMNDLPWSKTITTITQDIIFNTADFEKPEERYSFIFEGNAQALDYIFINKNLANRVLQARFVHVNTFLDFSKAFSDHDPMIIEFQLHH
jgi:predicted extracellular nuclease